MDLEALPSYTIRRSPRAKRINIRFCPERGFELIIPLRTSEKAALEFLNQQRNWILRHQALLQPKPVITELPKEVVLLALGKSWKIRYEEVAGYKKIKVLHLPNELVLYGEKLEFKHCLLELRRWVYTIAEKELYFMLRALSEQCQLPFSSLIIRNQATLWGSCSKEKNISLNVKLLFLPKTLAEYVLIHELCHTRYLNHSAKFWNLVASFVPDYQNHVRQLKQIKSHDFPGWIESDT